MAEKTLTKEQWAEIEKTLSGLYGSVNLTVDGRRVTLNRQLVNKNKLGIVTYIDGRWEGKWMNPKNECPEQRYMRRMERLAYSAKTRASLAKLPKRYLKERKIDPGAKIHMYDISWSSVGSIRRHYEKTFTSIELRPDDGQ